ncbi:MAG: ATP-binding protein [Candidatus Symbiodolus clandestinus]
MKPVNPLLIDPGAAEIQHDLQTLLARIRLATELLSSNDQELLAAIHRDINTCQLMLRQPFAPTDDPSERRVVTDLNQLIQEETKVMQQCYQAAIKQNLFSGSLSLLIQPLAIKRLLTNLLINAHTYGGDQTTISSGKTANSIWFQVADNGPGINSENPAYLMQPGVRGALAKSAATPIKGSGLGLAIVKKIVARHQGYLKLQSHLSQGLSITINLPA